MTDKDDQMPAEMPKSYDSKGALTIGKQRFAYQATAGWQTLFKADKKSAEMFHTYYRLGDKAAAGRPLTFVFNGGPGAASAYLHVGAVGPVRVETNKDGTLPPAPVKLVPNKESWLPFTDLVFIDPIGTGLSRTIKGNGKGEDEKQSPDDETYYWDVAKDLDSLCEFISAFLSKHGRWRSPIYIAGESYGGYRGARLARLLQEKGVGLSGAILISPVLEWDHLFASRFNTQAAAIRLPTYAAAARHHGRSERAVAREALSTFLKRAETYALGDYLTSFAMGARLSAADRKKQVATLSEWIGLTPDVLERHDGRPSIMTFVRELLRDEGKVLGLYDASYAVDDPLPASDSYAGVDPTLGGLDRLYVAGANAHLRENLGVDVEQQYKLLSMDVNRKWQWKNLAGGDPTPPGASEDVAVGLGMNPALKVLVVHGLYDLVTPYLDSKYFVEQLAQSSPTAEAVGFKTYEGGHMFYMWEKSRQAFAEDVRSLYGS